MLHDTVGAASLMAHGLSEAINIAWTQKRNGPQCLAFPWPRIAPNYKLIISHITAQKLVRRITDPLFFFFFFFSTDATIKDKQYRQEKGEVLMQFTPVKRNWLVTI